MQKHQEKLKVITEFARRSALTQCAAPFGQQALPQGLYCGIVPNVQRAALVNLGELSTYVTGPETMSDGPLGHFLTD